MDLSKYQRGAAYLYAIQMIKGDISADDTGAGICYYLDVYVRLYLGYKPSEDNNYEYLLKMFPEFALYKPDEATSKSYWWKSDKRGDLKRIEVLEQCIAQIDEEEQP